MSKKVKKSILLKAYEIVEKRTQEKSRQYGDFSECMTRAAKIASNMIGKEITTDDMFKCMIALKLSRESYSHKEDSLLDACAYIGGLNNYINSKKNDAKRKS